MPLEEDVEHEPVLVHCPPEPMSDPSNARPHLVEMPPGTPRLFPVTQAFDEKGAELDAPLAEGLVTDQGAALVKQRLHVSVIRWKAVVKPYGMLDDGHGEAVAVRLGVGHGASPYPQPVKATQPFQRHTLAFPAAPTQQIRQSLFPA